MTGDAAPHDYGTAGSVDVRVTSSKTTSGAVELLDGDTVIGSATVAGDGSATIVVPALALAVGSHTLALEYAGDAANAASSGTVLVVVEKATPTVTGSVDPDSVTVGEGMATVDIDVTATGFTPTGQVEVFVDGDFVARVSLSAGSSTAQVGPFGTAGSHTVTLQYLGDDHAEAASGSAGTVEAEKVTPRMSVTRTPDEVIVNRTRVELLVSVRAAGEPVTGEVRVHRPGYDVTRSLTDGEATFRLPKFKRTGLKTVTVVYRGSDTAERVVQEIQFRVRPKG